MSWDQLLRPPDITFRTKDPKFITTGSGLVLCEGVPGYVIQVTDHIDGEFTVTFRPSGGPPSVTPSRKEALKIDPVAFARVFESMPSGPSHMARFHECYTPKHYVSFGDRYMWHRPPGFMDAAISAVQHDNVERLSKIVQKSIEETFLYHPNCRCVTPAIPKETLVKVRNRFYVAAPSVTTASEQDQVNTSDKVHLMTQPNEPQSGKWTRHTLKDALAQAEKILEANPKQDHVAIVQIVRIVRRKKQPLVVETIR